MGRLCKCERKQKKEESCRTMRTSPTALNNICCFSNMLIDRMYFFWHSFSRMQTIAFSTVDSEHWTARLRKWWDVRSHACRHETRTSSSNDKINFACVPVCFCLRRYRYRFWSQIQLSGEKLRSHECQFLNGVFIFVLRNTISLDR